MFLTTFFFFFGVPPLISLNYQNKRIIRTFIKLAKSLFSNRFLMIWKKIAKIADVKIGLIKLCYKNLTSNFFQGHFSKSCINKMPRKILTKEKSSTFKSRILVIINYKLFELIVARNSITRVPLKDVDSSVLVYLCLSGALFLISFIPNFPKMYLKRYMGKKKHSE